MPGLLTFISFKIKAITKDSRGKNVANIVFDALESNWDSLQS